MRIFLAAFLALSLGYGRAGAESPDEDESYSEEEVKLRDAPSGRQIHQPSGRASRTPHRSRPVEAAAPYAPDASEPEDTETGSAPRPVPEIGSAEQSHAPEGTAGPRAGYSTPEPPAAAPGSPPPSVKRSGTPHVPAPGRRTPAAPPSAPPAPRGKPSPTLQDPKLAQAVIARALAVSQEINGSGGYRFDGRNDCYGFLRRVWDPLLASRGQAPLPVGDLPSGEWAPIRDWSALLIGDVLATHPGHKWGTDWHGGLFGGIGGGATLIYDNSSITGGARVRPHPGLFRFYYKRTHRLLGGTDTIEKPK